MDIPSHMAFDQCRGRTVHLGVSGSIAAFRALELLRMLQEAGLMVTTTLTAGASRFITPLSFKALGAHLVDTELFGHSDEEYAHLRPGMEADAFIIAPATANILAKAAHGLADDMLSCQVLSYPRPILFAPAMNTRMLQSTATQHNLCVLRERGHSIIDSEDGNLACGEQGSGRLASLPDMYLSVLHALAPQDMSGKRVLVTLGRTEESWDSVRRWTNPSSGTMGAALAIAAWLRGAEVHAVCGPCTLQLPKSIHRHDITTAQELYDTSMALWPDMDIGCCVAAVCDFRPRPAGQGKFKKDTAGQGLSIDFLPNPDTLATLGRHKSHSQCLVGFAAEADQLDEYIGHKLRKKNADLIVGNIVGGSDSGFQVGTNRVSILDRKGRKETWPLLGKCEIAWRVWDWLAVL